jgi:hypothetical protein
MSQSAQARVDAKSTSPWGTVPKRATAQGWGASVGSIGSSDEKVLHHSCIFMRKDVAMVDGLPFEILELHANYNLFGLGDPDRVLDRSRRLWDAAN